MLIWLFFIAIFLVILIVIYASVPWAEKKVLFFPSDKHKWKPKIPYKEIYIDVKTDKLYDSRPGKNCKREYINGWYFNNFPGHNVVLFSHGNSGNISNRSYIIDICQKFELNLFIFDYRGFGHSSGVPSKYHLKQDGEAAYKYLTARCKIHPNNIIVWGESLGGYVATWIASNYPCRSLILLCTFSGLDDAIGNYFTSGAAKALATGYGYMASLRFDIMPNRKHIRAVKCPVAIMHSPNDDVIPYECAKILYKNVNHRSKVLITIDGTHSAPKITKEQLNKLFMFCDIPLPFYDRKHNIGKMLKNVETVAERYHNFIDRK